MWRCAGIDLLSQYGEVETAYNLTPEQLCERIPTADALIIRSATQAGHFLLKGRAGMLTADYDSHHRSGTVFEGAVPCSDQRCHLQ